MLVTSLKYTPVTQSMQCLIFSKYVRTIQCLIYGEQESQTHFAVYNSDIAATLKQSQGHQTWYELVHPKQGYNYAKLENP